MRVRVVSYQKGPILLALTALAVVFLSIGVGFHLINSHRPLALRQRISDSLQRLIFGGIKIQPARTEDLGQSGQSERLRPSPTAFQPTLRPEQKQQLKETLEKSPALKGLPRSLREEILRQLK